MDSKEKETLSEGLSLQKIKARSAQLQYEADKLAVEQKRLNGDGTQLETEMVEFAKQVGISLSNLPDDAALDETMEIPKTASQWKPLDDPALIGYDEYLRKNGVDPNGDMLTQYFTPNEIQTLLQT